MKKLILITYILVLATYTCYGQAKKPTIMVVPSDVWCIQRGYFLEYDNQGTKTVVPDYKRAFQNDPQLILVISKINGLMAGRGFPLKNMESAIKTLESEAPEDNMRGVEESQTDKLKRVAKADIIMQLTWTIDSTEWPHRKVNFILQGIDAYTDKQIAEASGTGKASSNADTATLLGEAVVARIDEFNSTLQMYFDDVLANGREIIVRIKRFSNSSGVDLEKEYNGKDLATIIEDWMRANTIKGRFSLTDATENMMLFEQVRITLKDKNNDALDARGFVRLLQQYLNNPPYGITSKLTMKGLGQAAIILNYK